MTVEPQPAGPTFARSARVNGTCTTYERIYIYIYIKNIYIYMTKIFLSCTISVGLAPLANKYIYQDSQICTISTELASLAINILENATALGSRIPPHAVLLHVNNTPVKLKIISAIWRASEASEPLSYHVN